MSLVACMVHAAEPLRLEVAIERALAAHPALAAEAARLRAAEARAAHDSLPPPLVLGAQLEDVAGTGAVSGLDGAQATVQLERHPEALGGLGGASRRP
ncbi:MAG: TolC family protein, partial [Pseudomonadota bacterium]